MKIFEFCCGPIETNAYLLIDIDTKQAILIDAPSGVWEDAHLDLLGFDATLVAILLTHAHWDHMVDAQKIHAATGAPVYAHQAEQLLLEQPGVMAALMPKEVNILPVEVSHWLNKTGPETLQLIGQSIEVRSVPGHSPGGVAFYFPKMGCVFSGDALFADSVGRTDLPLSNADELKNSLRNQLYTLPANTIVYPGHGPATTIGEEAEHNPYIRRMP
jgi:hydroxyacylglutathione hydrolase